jgi:hypothetical protein
MITTIMTNTPKATHPAATFGPNLFPTAYPATETTIPQLTPARRVLRLGRRIRIA